MIAKILIYFAFLFWYGIGYIFGKYRDKD